MREDIGPGCWRFNNSFLQSESFLKLLDDVVGTFITSLSIVSTDRSPQNLWEAFKRAIKDTCETFSTGFRKSCNTTTIQQLQNDYQRLSLSNEDEDEARKVHLSDQIAHMLYQDIQRDMQRLRIRSATRWHESGERNTKYFYKVMIKSREAKQTIQAIKSSSSGELVTSTADILGEAHIFYSQLYSLTEID